MKKEVMKQWVEALRSGKYKQGPTRLKREDSTFCCLGVLCDISKLGTWYDANMKSGCFAYQINGSLSTETIASLPNEVREWAGMYDSMGQPRLESPPLYQLNDVENFSFEQIADFIEQNWEKL